jgi:hypoxanthine phosphoribosyltransferase
MKFKMTYDLMCSLCDHMTEQILKQYDRDAIRLVAVVRGGMTPAHRIAYNLSLPVDCFFPARKILTVSHVPGDHHDRKPILFIEDLVAKGRTLTTIAHYMERQLPNVPWKLCPVLVDANFGESHPFDIFGMRTDAWAVFPYEDMDKTKEKDWGMFRDGTSEGAKKGVTC